MIFLNLRTDLALERHEIAKESDCDGVFIDKYCEDGVTVTQIEVYNEAGEKALEKPKGKYLTFEVTPFSVGSELFSSGELRVLSRHIRSLVPQSDKPVLVAGLGNDEITADALGPQTASMIFSTRHITGEYAEGLGLGRLGNVAGISAGVLGKTGIEACELLKGIVGQISPCAVITVDALAARRIERLGTTVQMATSGIVPGSGVGNSRHRIDRKTLGVPVISIGVPMVVDGATFVNDILTGSGIEPSREGQRLKCGDITVTPKDIDIMTQRAARLIAMSINCAFQPELSPKEIFAIVSQ